MSNQNTLTLINPQTDNLVFKIFTFENNSLLDHILRNNYYSLIWIYQDDGKFKADFSEYSLSNNYLLSFSPYPTIHANA